MSSVTGWGNAKEVADAASTGGKYLSLANDGDKAVVAFIGEPLATEVIWEAPAGGGPDKPRPFTEEDRKAGKKPRVTLRFGVYNQAEKVVQVFEQGVVVFRQLLTLKDKYGFDDQYFEIERKGAKGNQKTTYSILPDARFTDEEKATIAGLELPNLERDDSDSDSSTPAADPPKSNESKGGKISDADKTALINELKKLPGEVQKGFLAEFKLEKVRSLDADKVADAMAWVKAKAEPAPADDDDGDPYG